MLQNQVPVRCWKQWLVLPALGGLFFLGSHAALAQVTPASDEAQQKAWQDDISRKTRLAEHEDSMRTGGKVEPGTAKQVNITYGDKPGHAAVTITRVPIPPAPQLMTTSGQKIYTYVEQMPQLPSGGGVQAITKQILDNFVYPAGEHKQGRLFASFTVAATGDVADVKIIKGLAPAYDEATLAAIRKLPRFLPGKQSGQAVAVNFTVPITFQDKP